MQLIHLNPLQRTPSASLRRSLLSSLVVGATVFASSSASAQDTPLSDFDLVNGLVSLHGAAVVHAQERLDLVDEYMDVFAAFDPIDFVTSLTNLFPTVFGETYDIDSSGIWSEGPPGPVDETTFVLAQTPAGSVATITELDLYAVTPSFWLYGFDANMGEPTDVELYTYTARMNGTDDQVGFATRFVMSTRSLLFFSPLETIPDGGRITGEDAAAFIEYVMNGPAGPGNDHLAWILARHGMNDSEMSYIANEQQPCEDLQELLDCVQMVINQYIADIGAAQDALDDKIKDILDTWGGVSLLTALYGIPAASGTGALIGAWGGPVGAGAGAAVGAVKGIITGGIAWLTGTAIHAEIAKGKIADARAEHAQKLCDLMREAADDLKDCFEEHCPELAAEFAAQIDLAVMQSGC